jgi:hypothetical protein
MGMNPETHHFEPLDTPQAFESAKSKGWKIFKTGEKVTLNGTDFSVVDIQPTKLVLRPFGLGPFPAPGVGEDIEAATFPVKTEDLIALSLKVAERAPDLEISPDATVKSAIKMIERICSVPAPVDQPFDMPPHQHRVLVEKSELEAKLGKLRSFFNSSTYGDMAATKKGREEQDRLKEQADIIDRYIAILRERIAAF